MFYVSNKILTNIMRKIYGVLLVATLLFAPKAFSQLGGTHNYLDTAYISPRNLAQQQDFLNNNSNFPAKPRDMWQVGVFAGFPYVDGDCPAALKGAGKGISSYSWGIGGFIRKALGYVVSVRASGAYYNMLGLDYEPNRNFVNHPAIRANYQNTPYYLHNFHTKAFVGSLEALVSLNNIMFHSKQGRWNIYALAGYTAFIYQTKMDVVDANGAPYPFSTIDRGQPRKEIRSALRKMLDGKYETTALSGFRRPNLGDYNLRHSFSAGIGVEYRVAKKTSVGVEYKRIQPRDDYVDGWWSQSGDMVNPVYTSEWDNIGFLSVSVNQNIGNSQKRIPPLWWMNPLEFAYSELNNPKHMKLPKVKLDDADGDGVTDQFDLEPNTPPGAPVDTHGVSKDTDGDGVPDYRDKELLTLQNCFPVDEDGIGNCPPDTCCNRLPPPAEECVLISSAGFPPIQFNGNSIILTNAAKALLNSVAAQLKANPNCKVKVSGHGGPNKAEQQLSWDRVNVIVRYLTEQQGIAGNRVIFEFGAAGDANTVDLIPLPGSAEGPATVPAPHPDLRKRKK